MHLVLTEVLCCPQCGPGFGLVLLSERVANRHVLEGWLGCPNCRERYRIGGGCADLRSGEHVSPSESARSSNEVPTTALHLAALLGVSEGPAFLLVIGSAGQQAQSLADMLSNVEVIAANTEVTETGERGVSRITVSERLPFNTGSMRGLAISEVETGTLLRESARVLMPGARLVLLAASDESEQRIVELGCRVLLHEGSVLVAETDAVKQPRGSL